MGSKQEMRETLPDTKLLITFVGMPGAGKSDATEYLEKKGIAFARFGDITDEGVRAEGKELTPENERAVRERLRREQGMGAYAIMMKPKIAGLLEKHDVIALDGLRSWDEYVLLKPEFPGLILIHIYSEPAKRYERLEKRKVRPLTREESQIRDIAEIENLDIGGPIAIADYVVVNNGDDKEAFHGDLDQLLTRLGVAV